MPGSKRWLRFSLRTLLVLFTCAVIAAALFSHWAQKRKGAFAAVRQAGGTIRMRQGKPGQLEKWFGSEVFGTVIEIDLSEVEADNALLAQIAALKELRRLNLSKAKIDDEGLRQIAHLPLRELWLQDTKITDAAAATISQMKTLDFLQLNTTSVSDGFLEQLEPLPELKDLGLRGTKVTGDGMRYLTRHPKLEELDVYATAVDDAGVEHLVDCTALTHAGLSRTKVTDQVFDSLGKLPNLTSADLSANRPVTTEAVLKFEKSHPKCDIEWYRK